MQFTDLYLQTFLAHYYLKLENYSESEKCYMELAKQNPDNTAYFNGLLGSRQLLSKGLIQNWYSLKSISHIEIENTLIVQYLEELLQGFPRSLVLKRLLLRYSNGTFTK
jgi:tetratricopeptide (TPR) repeat protein